MKPVGLTNSVSESIVECPPLGKKLKDEKNAYFLHEPFDDYLFLALSQTEWVRATKRTKKPVRHGVKNISLNARNAMIRSNAGPAIKR